MKQKSKFLSYALRHRPDEIGITLEEGGWTDVDRLLENAAAHGTAITRDELDQIVTENDKKRFTLSKNGTRIRAAQGHSVPVGLGLASVIPPDHLYHGTASKSLLAIRAEGLRPGYRQQVHLSADVATARAVGARHGKPHVFKVKARQMQGDGFEFYQADNGVWLTDTVPARYLADMDN